MIVIGGKGYELMLDHKDGWNPEAFRGRYSEVLERYDYIIGDWGYSQLRLKGFYRDNHPKVNRDTAISGMVDYINEYCNFGCAHFVLRKLKEQPLEGYKDILTKEPQEFVPAEDPDTEVSQIDAPVKDESSRPVNTKQHQSNTSSGKDGGAKDRPFRDNQGKKHRAKEAHGKKNPAREHQNRAPQAQPLDQQQ
ncbi:YutD family protein [Paenibacillus sp. BR2-3]|uniref:YutD family protein n=1 Tax=Paenibacillus sp. BR2-3 TaxID=3048494 RepID=UPI003977C758